MKKKIVSNWQLIVLLVLSGLVVWPLFVSGYFSHHDDLHVIRIFEMRKCFADRQIPCRWVPDMGYGNGYPLFNFYGVFAYYIGGILSFVLGFLGAAKALFFIPLVFGGIGMYFLAKEIFGEVPGFVTGVLYLFAPYRALDTYVRGAVAEIFAMSAVPFLLFYILRLIKKGERVYFLLGTTFLAIFLLSHNIMTLLFTPVILILTALFLLENGWKNWKKILWVFILGFGLSAFFVVPAFFEKGLVQTEALTRAELDFRAQFVKVGKLFFDRSWYYAGSNPREENTISYQIGWPHWWLVVLSLIVVVLKKKKKLIFLGILLVIFGFSIFMTHNKSAPIWEFFKVLVYVQFPWRFLSVTIFSASLLGGYFIFSFKGKFRYFLAILIVILSISLNWKYFRPQNFYYDITDSDKLTGELWLIQQRGSILDYLPKTALEPTEPAPKGPIVIRGDALVHNYISKSNMWSFYVDVDTNAVVNVPVFDFPKWITFIDGKSVDHSQSYPTGRIEIIIPDGQHYVSGIFKNTNLRTCANLLSITSLAVLLLLLAYGKNSKIYS